MPDSGIADGQALEVQKSRNWKSFADQNWDVFAFDWGRLYGDKPSGCSYQDVMNGLCPFWPPKAVSDFARTTHGFENVVTPVRLGEHQLLNDGLIGFWKETDDGKLDNVFHSPQTVEDLNLPADIVYQPGRTTPCIKAYSSATPDNLCLRIQDAPLNLTLLLDPRGVVHATSGVLPVQELQIPPQYYSSALNRMGVTFRVGPILTDSEQLFAALPKEPGFAWSWVTKLNGATWQESRNIVEATPRAEFFRDPTLVDGWFKLTPTDEKD